MVWLFLILAIVLEVGAALSLRLATGGRKLFYIAVVVGYLGAPAGPSRRVVGRR